MAERHLIYTSGDVMLVMADGGAVRGYRVLEDGALKEVNPGIELGERATPEPEPQPAGWLCCGRLPGGACIPCYKCRLHERMGV